ncbi:unnamed protein product [Arctia plantaginis]|uniref:Epoxide hydrolase N-terminal domain-containing protein n=1 Tax=Arctia plantaginis TaxID=874455 RepID=A0A8S0Z341_ARCPL|nr:unnamed protein product [Arctia plantaginis]
MIRRLCRRVYTRDVVMGFIIKLLVVAVVGVGAWYAWKGCCQKPIPHFDPEEYWGPKELASKQDKSIRPFTIKFDEEMIKDLKYRLKNSRSFTRPLESTGFEYGFNTDQMSSWLNYWADKYNFSEREKFLNQFPQFKTNIQGLDIHFIRVKPQVPKDIQVVPLLLMHGWPGSVREFYEAIPLLTKQTPGYNFVFEVIVPSIPGYGFSDPAVRPGLSLPHVAVIFRNLMNRLGYKKFYVQGGDWGAAIAATMSTLFPEDILGHHSNMLMSMHTCSVVRILLGGFFPSLVVESHLAERMYPLSTFFATVLEEFGYMHLQATKPDTIGVSLTDSPAGLLAYILEKFSTWTKKEYKSQPDGGLSSKFSKDQLIDNLMIYWSTKSITTSMRFYAENFSRKMQEYGLDQIPTAVPTWGLQAHNEIMYQPEGILKMKFTNIINLTVLDDGGHFLAFEMPQVFSQDVFKAVKAFRDKMARLLFLISMVALVLKIAMVVYLLFLKSPPPIPELDQNEWWGPGSRPEKQDITVKPFKIKFDDEVIADLKTRLKSSAAFVPPLKDVGFEYGFNSQYIGSWLKYWAEKYNFKERENFLNKYPHFKTNIQGLDIHFIRVTPKVPKGVETVPLLLLHGWPGSVREFYEAIPLLTAVSQERNFAIEVIAPSLPGYGFSDGAVRPGLGAPQIAVIFKNLMNRLGFKQFYIQGGDWGALISSNMVTLYPKDILGFHTNLAMTMTTTGSLLEFIGALYPPLIVDADLADRMYPLKKKYSELLEETGYMHLQASKPDTVGVALTDSPAGLLAYILEKFSTWTRPDHKNKPDGGLDFRFSKEQLIDNLMMYWVPKSITTSMRLYAENFNSKIMGLKLDEIPTPVPTWALQAKYELAYQPPCILKMKFTNLVDVSVIDDGGHFFAFELPEIFAKDVIKAIGEFRKRSKNVKSEL